MLIETRPVVSLHGKRGLVVGLANAHSIAWGCTRTAHAAGAKVVATCLNDKARALVAELVDPLGIPLINCNVEQDDALAQSVSQAVDALGGLDFVVHSIAWAPLADLHGPVLDSSREGFARAMNISCHSLAELARLCVPHMPRGGGTILTMSYLGAEVAVPHYGLMGPVKAALEALVRYLALELGPRQVRVHAVSPGPILTRAAAGIDHFDTLMANAITKAPLGRLVTLNEIGQLCAFLCSDAASGMTGQTLYVDAGVHAVD